MSSAAASIRCSQLSSTSRLGDCASRCAIRARMSARCSAVRARRPLTESRTPSTDPTSTATSSAAVTPASSTTWTTGCAASRASACASRVLPSPPGADDGHHPRAGHQRPQPGQVAVPADQLGRVVAHPPADRAVEREQAAVRALQQLAGIRAEPLAQVPAVALETLERGRRAADGGLAAQQVRQQRLVVRPLRVRRLERPAARPRARPSGWTPGPGSPARWPRPRRPPGGPPRAGRRPRQPPRAGRPSAPGPPAPARGGGRVPVEHGRGGAHELREPGAVDLARRGPQPVPGAVADDRVRAARAPGPRHQHLQALQARCSARRRPRRARSAPRPAPGGRRAPRAPPAAPAGDRPQPVSPASAHPRAGSGRCSRDQSRSADHLMTASAQGATGSSRCRSRCGGWRATIT